MKMPKICKSLFVLIVFFNLQNLRRNQELCHWLVISNRIIKISFTNDNFNRSMQKEFQFVILNFMLNLGQKYYLTLFV